LLPAVAALAARGSAVEPIVAAAMREVEPSQRSRRLIPALFVALFLSDFFSLINFLPGEPRI